MSNMDVQCVILIDYIFPSMCVLQPSLNPEHDKEVNQNKSLSAGVWGESVLTFLNGTWNMFISSLMKVSNVDWLWLYFCSTICSCLGTCLFINTEAWITLMRFQMRLGSHWIAWQWKWHCFYWCLFISVQQLWCYFGKGSCATLMRFPVQFGPMECANHIQNTTKAASVALHNRVKTSLQ